jgi:hypothetical protein
VWFEDELKEKVAAPVLAANVPVIWVNLCEGLTGIAP